MLQDHCEMMQRPNVPAGRGVIPFPQLGDDPIREERLCTGVLRQRKVHQPRHPFSLKAVEEGVFIYAHADQGPDLFHDLLPLLEQELEACQGQPVLNGPRHASP